jgi:hypothetical protein
MIPPLIAALLFTVCLSRSERNFQATKPIVVKEIHVDRLEPVAKLGAAVASAHAIVRGTIVSSRPVLGNVSPITQTIFSIRVDDLLKPHSMLLGGVIDVFRRGGDVDAGPTIESAKLDHYPLYSLPPH